MWYLVYDAVLREKNRLIAYFCILATKIPSGNGFCYTYGQTAKELYELLAVSVMILVLLLAGPAFEAPGSNQTFFVGLCYSVNPLLMEVALQVMVKCGNCPTPSSPW